MKHIIKHMVLTKKFKFHKNDNKIGNIFLKLNYLKIYDKYMFTVCIKNPKETSETFLHTLWLFDNIFLK